MQAAQNAVKSGHPDQAEKEFQAVLQLDGSNIEARANLGVLQFFAGEWTPAAENLRVALTAKPSLWRVEALLGIAEKRLGNPQKAAHLLGEALAHLDNSGIRVQAGLELLDLLYAAGDLDRAEDTVRALQRIAPSNVDVLYTAYRIHTDLANRALDSLAGSAPDNGRMHQLMAQHLINQGDFKGAMDQYEKALQIDNKLPGVHYELGETILDSSSTPDALDRATREFQAALRENPSNANAEYQLGRIDATREDFTAAQQHYNRALRMQPDHLWAHLGMGQALLKVGQPDAAVKHLAAAAKIDPANASAHFRLGTVYHELGRKDDATREMAEFQKLRQKDEQIQRLFSEMHQRVSPQHESVPESQ
jgi:tetratricopeptide (TPR) repeat protein